jgi:hypothetical protein
VASKYWIKLYHEILHDRIKLYHEILHDPKMGRLPDRLWRRAIELFLLAGENGDDGRLPSVEDMTWTLRLHPDEPLIDDLDDLEQVDIVAYDDDLQCWVVVHFAERQAPVSSTERVQRFRDREQRKIARGERPVTPTVTQEKRERNEGGTYRCTDTDLDTDLDTDTESEGDHGATAPASPPPPEPIAALDDVPDPESLTVKDIEALILTDEQWQALLEREKVGKNRSTVRRHVKAMLQRPPPAVVAYREVVQRFPIRALWDGMAATVGDELQDLEFWRQVVTHYAACGWNLGNVKAMLEHYRRRELPGSNGRRAQGREPINAAFLAEAQRLAMEEDL